MQKNKKRNKSTKISGKKKNYTKSTNYAAKQGSSLKSKKSHLKFIQRGKNSTEVHRMQRLAESRRAPDVGGDILDESMVSSFIQDNNSDNPFQSLVSKFKNKEQLPLDASWDIPEEDDDEEESTDDDSETHESLKTKLQESDRSNTNENDSEAEEDDLTNAETNNEGDKFSQSWEYDLDSEFVQNLLSSNMKSNKYSETWPTLGNLQVDIPTSMQSNHSENLKPNKKTLLDDNQVYASEGTKPVCTKLDLKEMGIKTQLLPNIMIGNECGNNSSNKLSNLQTELFSIINNYQDLFYPEQNHDNAEEIRYIYCLHVLNHMLKTRAAIIKNSAKLAGNTKKGLFNDNFRDQGLVRPKVAIVLPFRSSAFKVMEDMVKILYGPNSEQCKTNGTIKNYSRFHDEFTGDTIYFPKTNPKPVDYEKTFAGNTDDNFRIGISVTKKSLKLYTEFYSSDIILASPLGLRTIIGAPGDEERDFDFLNSIELLILDQAEIFLAQNWDHILHLMDHMHLQPENQRGTDYSRVRTWCINGLSRFYRQTLLFTSHELPQFRSFFHNRCINYRGKVHVMNPVVNFSMQNILVHIPQTFYKINVTSYKTSFDTRFQYFVQEILPKFKNSSISHCMIYIPSYFDFVRLRNYFKSETINCVQICEYSEKNKIARARDIFFHSGAPFMLYSERSHFFRRTRIKGIRHLIMYQPPSWPNLYAEIINLMQDSNQNAHDGLENHMSITILYDKYDVHQLSGIVGTENATKLIQSRNPTHVFRSN